LLEAIRDADRVIINGDFWEGYLCSFDELVASQWSKKLFPALLAKKAIYLFGNHDLKKLSDERVNLFCEKTASQYEFKSGDFTFIVEHGDRVYPMLDSRIGLMLPGWIIKILQSVEELALRIFGHGFTHHAYRPMNEKVKKGEIISQMDEHTYLVMGHTHYGEVDHNARYINSGFNKYGYISYVTVEDGKIDLIQKKYKE
jgi:predicted phosphodiesterase